jgi:MYXO-CTERM domain-containing protein
VATQSVFQQPLVTKDAIYWAFSTGASTGGILKSTDKGLTWHAMPADGIDYTAQPIALPDGSIAAVTTSHFVTISTNGGTSWTNVTPAIPLTSPLGLTYDPTGQALFAWKKSGRVQRMAYPLTAVDGGAAEAGSDAATPANDGATSDGATDDGGAAGAGGAPRTDAAIGGGIGGAAGHVPGPDAAIGAGGTGGGVTAGVGGQGGDTPVAHAPSSGGCSCATGVPTGLASSVPPSMLFPLSLFAGAALWRRRRR